MKGKVAFPLMLVLIAAIAVGCSSKGTETPNRSSQGTSATVAEVQKVALPEERPALIGKVKEIIGNEVTIYKAQIPQTPETPETSETSGTSKGEPVKSSQAQNQNQSDNGARPQNRGLRMNFTEETETFVIPVGTPIVAMQRGTQEASEVGLTGIKKDTVLRIWKKDDTISFVQVQAAGGSGQRGNQQGAGGNRAGSANSPDMGGPVVITGGPPAGMGGNR